MIHKVKSLFSDVFYCLSISFKTSKLYTIVRILIQAVKALLPIAGLYILKVILDVLVSGTGEAIISTFLVLIIVYLAIQVSGEWLTKLKEYFQKIHDEMMSNYINRLIIEKSSKIDLSFFDSPKYYDKIKLLHMNSHAVNQIVWNVVDCISNIVTFLAAFIVMFQFNPLFSCIIIVSYVPIAILDQIYIRKLYNWQVENVGDERKFEYVSSLITQKIHAKNIRIFGIAEYLVDIYKSLWQSWFSKRKKIIKKWSVISLVLSTAPQLLTVFILFQVGVNIINGQNSIGDFSLYSGMIAQLVASIFLIAFAVVRISENKIRIKDFREFDGWVSSVENTGEIELTSLEKICFCNVSFTYPGNTQPTIKNLSIEINVKERLALVGVNGAGKTTIIKLLLRFYNVSDGCILINGTDIKRFTPASIRKFFSVMFQDYINYAFTLRDNIKISDIHKKHTEHEILEACRQSGVDEVFKDWDKGLDSYLYKEFVREGRELSGGENQKIALGRTFYRGGEMIILDEPSSSLDPESEYILFKKMIELCRDKGVILISHRLSNVVLADRILVIEDGELIEQGSHSELINKNGRYAKLFQYQAERYNIVS